ncbi:DUF2798 domain-containing protein [Acinetobacter sp. MB5]|uniref:DUF2798 domain-containing protein n=1 Tax=Acinetobacter sp. MB5 TaxID=2069438 RepID=UPI0039B6F8EF
MLMQYSRLHLYIECWFLSESKNCIHLINALNYLNKFYLCRCKSYLMPRIVSVFLKLGGLMIFHTLIKFFPKIHVRHISWILPLILSGLMSGTLSFFNLARSQGIHNGFLLKWLSNWPLSWMIAFPLILIFAPIVRKFLCYVTYE